MRIYKYILFLRHPVNLDCINQEIEVDCDTEFLTIHDLLFKLNRSSNLFDKGYTLVGMNIHSVVDEEFVVNWNDAPPGTQAYAKDEDGACHWYIGGGPELSLEAGKFLCEAWVIREPAPDYKLNCEWHESLIFKPTS